MSTEAVKIQVQCLSLPISRRTFDGQLAVGHEQFKKVRCLRGRDLLSQCMPQWAGHVRHSTFGIQVHLQTDALHAQGCRLDLLRWRVAVEQTPEQFVPGTQNCRLELALRFAGRLGTGPIPGSTRNGMTCFSLFVG